MIFETERLLIRKLIFSDLNQFHLLESNPNVLHYTSGKVKSLHENEIELKNLIESYKKINNNFWIYAIESKKEAAFMGTVALVKDTNDDEIGYRFLEKYWGNGYGFEVCKGLILYCKKIGIKKIIAYAVDENIASSNILKNLQFIPIKHLVNEKNQQETKYQLFL